MKNVILIMAGLFTIFALFGACADNDDDTEYYTIVFDTDGGVPALGTSNVLSGSGLMLPGETVKKEGYTLTGWKITKLAAKEGDFAEEFDAREFYRPSCAVKITAQWQANSAS